VFFAGYGIIIKQEAQLFQSKLIILHLFTVWNYGRLEKYLYGLRDIPCRTQRVNHICNNSTQLKFIEKR